MQWVIHSLLVLAICEPLFLAAKKVVIVMPRHQRRSQSAPWSQLRQYKKNGYPNSGIPGQKYGYTQGPQLYRPKPLHFAKEQYPHGGDDFDQGHEEVNHVMVPHGKGISHAVSFGKGYIPFDTYKDHRPSASHHHNYEAEYPSGQDIGYGSGINYSSGPSYSQALLSEQADSYVGNEDNNNGKDGLQDRVHDRTVQNFADSKSPYDTTNTPSVGGHFGAQGLTSKPSVGVFTPAGIPSATIGGSKTGIVLRDSVFFDEYNRKVAEFTKNWPASFTNANHLIPGSLGNTRHGTLQQLHDLSRQYDGTGFSGGLNFASNLGQHQQGYEVKEDVVDTPPDFRTMPIQTAPVQPPQQHVQYIHQPVQQAVQQIYSQPQSVPQMPLNYGNHNNYQGFLHK